jgi:Sulfotransferase family
MVADRGPSEKAGTISAEQLLSEAAGKAALDDYGDVPFAEALQVLVRSFNEDAGVSGSVQARVREMLTGVLVKRLRLVADRARNPGIAEEAIDAPIFIVGPPRSGSTHLHALLACVTGARAPLMWEMSAPSPPPERSGAATDPRIAEVQAVIDQLPPELLIRHPMSATRPEQCNLLNDWSFLNQAWMASFDISSYRDWYLGADYAPMYEAHRRTLQQLQWRHPGRWVLKYPKHLLSLDALLDAYPDALLVWTHRDPTIVLPSALSLTGLMRESNTPEFDRKQFGAEWVVMEELSLHRGLATRDGGTLRPERNFDLHYDTMMNDPIGAVSAVCDWAGMDFDDRSHQAVQQWLDDHPKDQHGAHRYTAEEFGLDPDGLRARFRFYTHRFGISS